MQKSHKEDRVFVYRVDDLDQIVFVDDEWLLFAKQNDARDLTRDKVVGKRIWDFVSDQSTRQIYQLLFDQVRAKETELAVQFRCDSPECRRSMEMTVRPLGSRHLELRVVLLEAVPRRPIELLGRSAPRSSQLLRMCSWCKRISISDHWVEVEDAVSTMALFEEPTLPTITHGICPTCLSKLMSARDAAGTLEDG